MSGDFARSEAAAWYVQLQRTDVDHKALEDFRAWRSNAEHDRAFRDVEKLWHASGGLEHDPDVQAALAHAQSHRPTASREHKRRVPSPYVWVASAVAGAAAVVVIGLIIGPLLRSGELYRTGVGQQSTARLSDGSTLRLDADSRVKVRMAAGRRSVVLEKGQALFDVAHDPARPFVVTAGPVQVTAVGTRFDVRRSVAGEVRVALLQGRARVMRAGSGASRSWTLDSGQALDAANARAEPAPLNPDAVTAWTTGRLVFRETTLSDAVAESNRYSRTRLELASQGPWTTVSIDGVFVAGDADALARALSALYGFSLSRKPDGAIVLGPPAAAGARSAS